VYTVRMTTVFEMRNLRISFEINLLSPERASA